MISRTTGVSFLTAALLLGAGCGALDNLTGTTDDSTASSNSASQPTVDTSSIDDENASIEEAATAAVNNNQLAGTIPGTLALAVLSQDDGTSLTLTPGAAGEKFDPSRQNARSKSKDNQKILAGTADSCLPDALGKEFEQATEELCYEFDQDMLYGTNDTGGGMSRTLGTVDGKNTAGEACLVAFTRVQVTQVIALVDQTLGTGTAAMCQFRKDTEGAIELPAVGEAIDLTESLAGALGDNATVNSATIERLEDVDGNETFRFLAEMEFGSLTRTVGIVHTRADENNEEYSGTLYTVMDGNPFGGGGPALAATATPVQPAVNPTPVAGGGTPVAPAGGGTPVAPAGGAQPAPGGASTTSKHQYMSISYQRTKVNADTEDEYFQMKAELIQARFDENIEGVITDEGKIDLNAGTNVATGTVDTEGYGDYTGYSQANDAVEGITFVSFDINPENGVGSLSYWKNPGGNYYEAARGFNIKVEEDDAGIIRGCATSGAASIDFSYGTSIRRVRNEAEAANALTLDPKGFWHPFMNTPDNKVPSTDGTGDFYTRSQPSGQTTKWYVPRISVAKSAETFSTKDRGNIITRQCFVYDTASQMYLVDAEKITEAAGYELLDTTDAAVADKLIAPPPPPDVKPVELDPLKKVDAENVKKVASKTSTTTTTTDSKTTTEKAAETKTATDTKTTTTGTTSAGTTPAK